MNNPNLPSVDAKFEYTPEMVAEIQRCKDDIIHFAESYFFIVNLDLGKIKIQLHDCQKRALDKMINHKRVLLLASRQIGKALALDTPIATPNGWTTMGKLKDGDNVYGTDGTPVKVIKAHDVLYNRECYEVEFDSGEKIIADKDHNWFTQSYTEKVESIEGSIKTTEQIINSGEEHRIPACNRGINSGSDIEWHYIKNITKTESVPVRCITVDSKDSLFLCGKQYIPTSNTTLMTIFSLWVSIFQGDQKVLIVANKEGTAQEILSRIRMAYEQLPNWLKPGVKAWGKTAVEFANDSKIGISTTTGTAARGQSCNCVDGNSVVTLRDKETGEIFKSTMEELSKLLDEEIMINIIP